MSKNISNTTSKEAYDKTQLEISELIEKINAGLKKHYRKSTSTYSGPNWAQVGDLVALKEMLSSLSDQLNGTGEYSK